MRMKFFLSFVILLVLLFPCRLSSQNWFPLGATWSYAASDLSGGTDLIILKVVSDTTITGISCKVFKQSYYTRALFATVVDTFAERNLYGYERNDSVYFLQGGSFVLLYNFNMQVGDSSNKTELVVDTPIVLANYVDAIPFYHVQSLDSFTLQGQVIKYYNDTIYTNASPKRFRTIQRIGTTTFIYPNICGACVSLIFNLQCYTDSVIGTYYADANCNPFEPGPPFRVELGNGQRVCSGMVDTLYMNVYNGSPPFTYQWAASGGAVLSCTTCALPNVTITGNANVSVTVTDAHTAADVSIKNFTIGSGGNIPVVAGGATAFCVGDSVTLYAGNGFSSYIWSNGSTNSSITVGQTNTYKVTVTVNSNCSSTGGLSVNAVPPLTAETITGASDITPYQSYVYAVSQVAGRSYIWSALGGVIQSGQGTNSINVLWGGSTPYLVSEVQSAAGSCPSTSTLQVLSTGIAGLDINSLNVSAYYNGTQSVIKVSSEVPVLYSLQLYDVSGRLVFNKASSYAPETILPGNLAKGIYVAGLGFMNGLARNIKVVVH